MKQSKRKWISKYRNQLVMGATLLTAALAVIGSLQYYGTDLYAKHAAPGRLWSAVLQSTLKMFVFSPTAYAGTATPLCYEIAKWMAPLCTGYWVFSALEILLRHRVELIVRRIEKRHQIAVIGYHEDSRLYVSHLAEKSNAFAPVLMSDTPISQEEKLKLERMRILVSEMPLLAGSGPEEHEDFLWYLTKRYEEIVLFYEDATLNFVIFSRILNYMKKNLKSEGPVLCAVRCESRTMEKVISDFYDRERGNGNLRLRLFHLPGMAARELLEREPLYANCLAWAKLRVEEERKKRGELSPREIMEQIPNPHLLIAGFGRYGQAVLHEALLTGTLSCYSTVKGYEKFRVTILDRDGARVREQIESRYPRIDTMCQIQYLDTGLESARVERELGELPKPTYVVVNFSDQTTGIGAVEKLVRCLFSDGCARQEGIAFSACPIPAVVAVRMADSGDALRYWAGRWSEDTETLCRVVSYGLKKEILTRKNLVWRKRKPLLSTVLMKLSAAVWMGSRRAACPRRSCGGS